MMRVSEDTHGNQSDSLLTLLPKCLEIIKNDLKTAELRVAFDAPTRQTNFQYKLIWEDVDGSEEKYRVAVTEANKMRIALQSKKLHRSNLETARDRTPTKSEKLENAQFTRQSSKFPPDLRTYSEQRDSSSSTSSSSYSSSYSDSDSAESSRQLRSMSLDGLEPVGVRIVVIDSPNFRGKLRPKASFDSTMTTRVKTLLSDVLREHIGGRPIEKTPHSSNVLFAFKSRTGAQRLRRIRKSDLQHVTLSNLPKCRGNVVLIVDLIDYIQKGKKIPIQIELDN